MAEKAASEATQPVASTPEPAQPTLEARVAALEAAMSGHNHEVGTDLIRLIAAEAKKEVLAHLKRQFGAHIAHFLLDGMPE